MNFFDALLNVLLLQCINPISLVGIVGFVFISNSEPFSSSSFRKSFVRYPIPNPNFVNSYTNE